AVHLLAAVGPGVHVAMHAGLIAAVAEIDLQGVEAAAADRRKRNRFEERPSVAHEAPKGRCLFTKLARSRRFVTPTGGSGGQISVRSWCGSRLLAGGGRRRERRRAIESDAAEARQLHGRMAHVEAGDQAE